MPWGASSGERWPRASDNSGTRLVFVGGRLRTGRTGSTGRASQACVRGWAVREVKARWSPTNTHRSAMWPPSSTSSGSETLGGTFDALDRPMTECLLANGQEVGFSTPSCGHPAHTSFPSPMVDGEKHAKKNVAVLILSRPTHYAAYWRRRRKARLQPRRSRGRCETTTSSSGGIGRRKRPYPPCRPARPLVRP